MDAHASSLDPPYGLRPTETRPRFRSPWPSVGELLALRHTQWFNVGRRCHFHWVALRSRYWRLLVDAAVAECPAIAVALKKHPVIFRPLVTRFLTADSTLQDRFHAFAHDLAFTATRIHRSFPEFLTGSSRQLLWSECGYAIELALNTDSPQEGLWRIDLKDGSGRRVFTASFSVLPGAVMFIGALQGATVIEGTDPCASVRAATKHFSGLRPQCLLLQVLRCIASAWRVRDIVGVSDKQQVTIRSGRRSRASITFSYDGYFLESGARPSICGNWRVPVERTARDTGSIPSRKRSMYRRRQSQIQQLECQIASQLR